MKKITKILLVFLIAALCVGSFAACGGGSGGMTSDGRYILSVYRGRSSGMIDGKDDALVTEAIEKKFKEDTGIGIDLQMTLKRIRPFRRKSIWTTRKKTNRWISYSITPART